MNRIRFPVGRGREATAWSSLARLEAMLLLLLVSSSSGGGGGGEKPAGQEPEAATATDRGCCCSDDRETQRIAGTAGAPCAFLLAGTGADADTTLAVVAARGTGGMAVGDEGLSRTD
jgi:hypothetical protein